MATPEPSPSRVVILDPASRAPDDSFAAWLIRQRQGLLHQQLTEALAAMVLAACDAGRPAELQLKLKFCPCPDQEGLFEIIDEVVRKPPRTPKPDLFRFDDQTLALEPAAPALETYHEQRELPAEPFA